MSEFRVGQRVRVNPYGLSYAGETGVITEIRNKPTFPPYLVKFSEDDDRWFDADELDPADPPASDDEAFDPEAFCALFDAALAEAHRAALAGELRDQKPLVAVDQYVEGIGYALDAARRERDAAVRALRELIDHATENADSDNFMAINQLVKIAKRGLNDDHE